MVSLKKKLPQGVETKSSPDINHFCFTMNKKTIRKLRRYHIASSIALNINTIIYKHHKFCMSLYDSLKISIDYSFFILIFYLKIYFKCKLIVH